MTHLANCATTAGEGLLIFAGFVAIAFLAVALLFALVWGVTRLMDGDL